MSGNPDLISLLLLLPYLVNNLPLLWHESRKSKQHLCILKGLAILENHHSKFIHCIKMTASIYFHKKFDKIRKRPQEEPITNPSKKIKFSIDSIVKSEPIIKKETIEPIPIKVPDESLKFEVPEIKISQQTLSEICKYHKNMARKYPTKMRSPKDQEKRDKNTIACRMSRRLKKLEEVAIEEQYKTFKDQYMANLLETQRIVHYMKELIKLS